MSLKISMVALTFFLFTLVDNFEIYIENENSNQFITMKMVKNELFYERSSPSIIFIEDTKFFSSSFFYYIYFLHV